MKQETYLKLRFNWFSVDVPKFAIYQSFLIIFHKFVNRKLCLFCFENAFAYVFTFILHFIVWNFSCTIIQSFSGTFAYWSNCSCKERLKCNVSFKNTQYLLKKLEYIFKSEYIQSMFKLKYQGSHKQGKYRISGKLENRLKCLGIF